MTAAAYERLTDLEQRGRLRLATTTKIRGIIVSLAAVDPTMTWSNVRRLLTTELRLTTGELQRTAPWARSRWIAASVRGFFDMRAAVGPRRRLITGYQVSKDGRRVLAWLKDGSLETWTRRADGLKLSAVLCWEARR